MKVYRIDFDWGEYHTLTELELNTEFTKEEIQAIKDSENHIIFETPYTERQLNRARKLHKDENWVYAFEEEYNISPDVYDILKHLYS